MTDSWPVIVFLAGLCALAAVVAVVALSVAPHLVGVN